MDALEFDCVPELVRKLFSLTFIAKNLDKGVRRLLWVVRCLKGLHRFYSPQGEQRGSADDNLPNSTSTDLTIYEYF